MKNKVCKVVFVLGIFFILIPFLITSVYASFVYVKPLKSVVMECKLSMVFQPPLESNNDVITDTTIEEINNKNSTIHESISNRQNYFLGIAAFGKGYVGTMDPVEGDNIRKNMGITDNTTSVIIKINDNIAGKIKSYDVFITYEDLSKYKRGDMVQIVYKTSFTRQDTISPFVKGVTINGKAPVNVYDEIGKLPHEEKIPSFNVNRWKQI